MVKQLEPVLALQGQWQGHSHLYLAEIGSAARSSITASVTPVLDQHFVRLDYQWQHEDQPQQGFMIFGYQPSSDLACLHWADTWHMGRDIMVLKGTLGLDTGWNVFGTYSATTGPDWGWRIKLKPDPQQTLINMFNVTPDGIQTLAVETVLQRSV